MPDDTAYIQGLCSTPGRQSLPAGVFTISDTILVDIDNMFMGGEGQGGQGSGIVDTRASAATRIVWDAAAPAKSMFKLTVPPGGTIRDACGLSRLMLDGNNKALHCIDVHTHKNGFFENLHLYGATKSQILWDVHEGYVPSGSYSSFNNTFLMVHAHSKNLWNGSYGLIAAGGKADEGRETGNTCFQRLISCQIVGSNKDGGIFKDSDNCMAYGTTWSYERNDALVEGSGTYLGDYYGIVLGSADQDDGTHTPKASARYHQFHGGQCNGLLVRASQLGGSSPTRNRYWGYPFSNGCPHPVFEPPAGGSEWGSLVYESTEANDLVPVNAIDLGSIQTLKRHWSVMVVAGGKAQTLLPAKVFGPAQSKIFYYFNRDAIKTVTISAVTGETINGAASIVLQPLKGAVVFPEPTVGAWYAIGL